jgi:glucosylceramidase
MEGVGAALTDSSAYLISQTLSGYDRSALINDLFGASGANLNYVRLPLSSSDMATEDFTHDDMEYPQTDESLSNFRLNPNHTYNIPLLHQITNANINVRMVGSAWSAPGWMKEGN